MSSARACSRSAMALRARSRGTSSGDRFRSAKSSPLVAEAGGSTCAEAMGASEIGGDDGGADDDKALVADGAAGSDIRSTATGDQSEPACGAALPLAVGTSRTAALDFGTSLAVRLTMTPPAVQTPTTHAIPIQWTFVRRATFDAAAPMPLPATPAPAAAAGAASVCTATSSARSLKPGGAPTRPCRKSSRTSSSPADDDSRLGSLTATSHRMADRRSPARDEALEDLARLAQTRSDRTRRNGQEMRDLGHRQLLDLVEHEDHALVLRDGAKNLVQRVVGTSLVDELLRARVGSDEGVDIRARGGRPAVRGAPGVLGNAHGRVEEERHFSAGGDVLQPPGKHAQDLLRGVFDARVGHAEVAKGTPDEVIVLIDEVP